MNIRKIAGGRVVIVALYAMFAQQGYADEVLVGRDLVTSEGQPFCDNKDQLQEYLLALLKNDKAWMSQLKGCGSFKAGLKVAVIDDYNGSDVGHVVKARLFIGHDSVVAYTISIGLELAKAK